MNIQLMNGPGFGENNGENHVNGRKFHRGTKHIITIHTCNLKFAITCKISFVTLKTTIRFRFMFENRHTMNDIDSISSQNQILNIIFN